MRDRRLKVFDRPPKESSSAGELLDRIIERYTATPRDCKDFVNYSLREYKDEKRRKGEMR